MNGVTYISPEEVRWKELMAGFGPQTGWVLLTWRHPCVLMWIVAPAGRRYKVVRADEMQGRFLLGLGGRRWYHLTAAETIDGAVVLKEG